MKAGNANDKQMANLTKNEYTKRFKAAEEKLVELGHETINPCDLDKLPLTTDEYMKIDLTLVYFSDAIYMLRGWQNSAGAKREKEEAETLGIEIMYEEE